MPANGDFLEKWLTLPTLSPSESLSLLSYIVCKSSSVVSQKAKPTLIRLDLLNLYWQTILQGHIADGEQSNKVLAL